MKRILRHKLFLLFSGALLTVVAMGRHVDAGPNIAENVVSGPGGTRWPDIPYAPPPDFGDPIALPGLPSMPIWYRMGYLTLTKPVLGIARSRLDALVAAHPDAAFRSAFQSEVSSGALNIQWTDWPASHPASFCLEPAGLEPGDAFDRDSARLQPTMFLSLYAINDADTWDEQVEFLLTLEHEFLHARQAREETEAERRDAHIDRAYLRPAPQTREQCRHRWRDEREAYLLEARDTYAWGYRDGVSNLNARVQTPAAFDQILFMQFLYWYGNAYPECVQDWAELAGAPMDDPPRP
ncbi:MAG: hypothetical protein WCO25_02890 [Candidatus Uhrbacteria bacterium]